MAKKKNNKTFRDLVRTTQQGQDKYNKSKFPKVKVSELEMMVEKSGSIPKLGLGIRKNSFFL